jgi:hypothetical protein
MPAAATPGRVVLGLVAVTTGVGGYIADWNHTHVYNPRWPPHAKFHNGQTMSSALLLGFSALYYIVYPTANQQESLHFVVLLLSLNWVAQLSAALYPGALPMDPEFGQEFPQAYICAVLFAFIGVGYALERSRIVRVHSQIHPKTA